MTKSLASQLTAVTKLLCEVARTAVPVTKNDLQEAVDNLKQLICQGGSPMSNSSYAQATMGSCTSAYPSKSPQNPEIKEKQMFIST